MVNIITYWYPTDNLRNRIGYITDILSLGFVELQDMETKEYTIKQYKQLQITNNEIL